MKDIKPEIDHYLLAELNKTTMIQIVLYNCIFINSINKFNDFDYIKLLINKRKRYFLMNLVLRIVQSSLKPTISVKLCYMRMIFAITRVINIRKHLLISLQKTLVFTFLQQFFQKNMPLVHIKIQYVLLIFPQTFYLVCHLILNTLT